MRKGNYVIIIKRLGLSLAVVSALSFGIVGCSGSDSNQEMAVKISSEKYYNEFSKSYIPQVVITSISDDVTIENVVINKGNCKYLKEEMYGTYKHPKTRKIFPKKLDYGKKLKITVQRCDVLRVDIETNQGDWSVEY